MAAYIKISKSLTHLWKYEIEVHQTNIGRQICQTQTLWILVDHSYGCALCYIDTSYDANIDEIIPNCDFCYNFFLKWTYLSLMVGNVENKKSENHVKRTADVRSYRRQIDEIDNTYVFLYKKKTFRRHKRWLVDLLLIKEGMSIEEGMSEPLYLLATIGWAKITCVRWNCSHSVYMKIGENCTTACNENARCKYVKGKLK